MDTTATSIVNKAANEPIATTTLTNGGLLQPYQAKQFIRQMFDVAPLAKQVRQVMHTEKSGYISKINIGRRLLRAKVEATDDGYRASVGTSQISYQTVPVRLPWEVTENALRENIEGQSLAQLITDMMTQQLGNDLEDLYLNGDSSLAEATAFDAAKAYAKDDIVTNAGKLYRFTAAHAAGAWSGTDAAEIGDESDPLFLGLNDGWIKQIRKDGHVTDAAGEKNLPDVFDAAVDSLPEKYIRALGLSWVMHPQMARNWMRYVRDQVVEHGGIVDSEMYRKPSNIPIIETPFMPEDTVLLTEPKNLIVVNTYEVKVREDRSSKEAIMRDMRFYVTHLDFDNIIEETDATGIITNIGKSATSGG